MSELSRRNFLAVAAAGAAGSTLVSAPLAAPALAAAPPAATQVPSAYRYKVGDVEATVVSDGVRTFPLADNFVRNQPREAVNAALKAGFLPENQVTVNFNILLLNTGGKLVVVDTGNGPAQGTVGLSQGTMAAIGIDPKTVDAVVISHFHGDHINGLLTAQGTPAFPNAQVMVPEAEWAFWMDDGAMSRAPDAMKGAFQNARRVFKPFEGKVEKYGWDKEIVPNLTPVATNGHTPGHTSFRLASGNSSLFIQSDVTNIPVLFLRNPSWHVMYDMDAAKAEETRKRVYDMVSAERMLVAGFHFPFPAAAHVEKDGANYRYVPINWMPVL
ncbi:MBL fold metallo-hydrolase [Aquabacter spiritensis]|uniref:Glyoxylase-like metal-dependent hydrolase (Beta-lactamase superfamily II) n=1 Tax=Aquabacter spiritensis TaxID=933073 RepID=A0A4R3M3G5_9HYPH|nr:MBL fold metallo-hydrolase [Aquabacter spiritensis]TCT07781.1 glyoxylase-like metal-dependent hydrolase (beta-lactamase superfamily II) [Aquabacter spiritensis]